MAGEVEDETVNPEEDNPQARSKVVHQCDRCGFDMIEMNCKVVCPNCGNRFDCSDLNIYFE
jgi:rubrerythrin